MGEECVDRHDLRGGGVGGGWDDRRGDAGVLRFQPAGCAEAPPVAVVETREAPLGAWCGEVVAFGAGEIEEFSGEDRAHGVLAGVF